MTRTAIGPRKSVDRLLGTVSEELYVSSADHNGGWGPMILTAELPPLPRDLPNFYAPPVSLRGSTFTRKIQTIRTCVPEGLVLPGRGRAMRLAVTIDFIAEVTP